MQDCLAAKILLLQIRSFLRNSKNTAGTERTGRKKDARLQEVGYKAY